MAGRPGAFLTWRRHDCRAKGGTRTTGKAVVRSLPVVLKCGGKASIASEVWDRFGKVDNYVEGFFGTGAVLLAAPEPAPVETGNDSDGFLCNFWRAVSTCPEEVADYASWPVSEIDLHARHAYLVKRTPWLVDRLMGDPSFCDPKLAGWWVWGLCAWIGGGWCCGKGPWTESGGMLLHRDELAANEPGIRRKLPHLGDAGQGIERVSIRRRIPNLTAGYNAGGTGVHGAGVSRQLPHLGGGSGTTPGRGVGVHGAGVSVQLPHLSTGYRGKPSTGQKINAGGAAPIKEWFCALQARLRRVRFACGDWRRVLTPSVTHRHGLTAVFLDPPYKGGDFEYSGGGGPDPTMHADLEAWCRENESNPQMRIALCGHEGDYDLPGWEVLRWKARGGYGNQGRGEKGESLDAEDNRHREMILFSPACLRGRQGLLF